MCGITGFFNNPEAVQLAIGSLKTLENRGRDGYGFFDGKTIGTAKSLAGLEKKKAKSKNCIAHCLHSVVGNVKQPVKNKAVLVANCEIYNWKQLKERQGIKARNDAELLLKLLEKQKNEKQLKKLLWELNGVFAFAFWSKNKVVLARDVLGEKPVWFSLENGLAFASEKKALEKNGFLETRELHPRKMLVYDIRKNRAKFFSQKFFSLPKETTKTLQEAEEKLLELLQESVKARLPKKRFGILFSGGVDSTLLAMVCKNLGAEFICYIGVVQEKGEKPPIDLDKAEAVAQKLGLKLKTKTISLEGTEKYLEKIVPVIEDSNVVKAGVALPVFLACERAKEDGIKVVFSALGADELFAGYERFQKNHSVNKDALSMLRKMFERDLYRDDTIAMANSIELRLPFLDKKLIEFALSVPGNHKIEENRKKVILRNIAKRIGVQEEIAERKKTAAQYGSNADWALEKLAKKNKCKTKSEYLKSFYSNPNLVLGALVSGGKDSLYALETMHRQNYKIGCLITLKSINRHSFMFHVPNTHLVKLQAEALGVPLVEQKTEGEKEKELIDLEKAIKKAVQKFGIQGIVSGALYSNYQRERIEKICERLGLKAFAPLWHANQRKEMQELIAKKYSIIFSSIAAAGIPKEWLGKEIDALKLEKLAGLHKKNGLNIAGEGGEFETLVLDMPLFRKKIKIVKEEKIETGRESMVLSVKKAALEEKTPQVLELRKET